MSGTESKNIRTTGFLSKDDIGVCRTAGEMVNKRCAVHRPLPCIVILVHGVNDVGEAYQNQDEGLCAGLNDRLGRSDLHPHSWKDQEFMITDLNGNATCTCDVTKQTCIDKTNRSPVIPFYWGYRPVDKEIWRDDQLRYRDELRKKGNEADLPYDAYRENDKQKLRQHNNARIDNYRNWLDPAGVKGGGMFANATTSIPDMFGPGMAGWTTAAAGVVSRTSLFNDGDWSHPVYLNPHRILYDYSIRENWPVLSDGVIIQARGKGNTLDGRAFNKKLDEIIKNVNDKLGPFPCWSSYIINHFGIMHSAHGGPAANRPFATAILTTYGGTISGRQDALGKVRISRSFLPKLTR